MDLPRPSSLRLHTRGRATPRPPLGVPAWTAGAPHVCVVLEGSARDLETVAQIAAQIPAPNTVSAGAILVVLGTAGPPPSLWARLVPGSRLRISRALRCSALIALGYVAVGAGVDPSSGEDVVWGLGPAPSQ